MAMQKESRSPWHRINSLLSMHPPTFKRILLLREIEQEMGHGQVQQRQSLCPV
ncbi:MAG: hypothetical protein ABSG33_03880 [Candidatus Bathyarchaeia archaeon]